MSDLARADQDSLARSLDENSANQLVGRIASLFVAFGIAPGLLLRLGRRRGRGVIGGGEAGANAVTASSDLGRHRRSRVGTPSCPSAVLIRLIAAPSPSLPDDPTTTGRSARPLTARGQGGQS